MILAALQLVVVFVLVFVIVDAVEVVAAAALQLGQIVVDALDIVVEIVHQLLNALHAVAEVAQQLHHGGEQPALGGIIRKIQALHQSFQVADLLSEIFHVQFPPQFWQIEPKQNEKTHSALESGSWFCNYARPRYSPPSRVSIFSLSPTLMNSGT